MKSIELDIETADRITVLSLKNYRDSLKKELREWKKNPKSDSNPTGYWLHADDVVGNTRRIKLIEELLKDFEC
jgi:hypothetical protein